MGFRGYQFFSPKSCKAKYSTLGTSEDNFGGKKPHIILREVRYETAVVSESSVFKPLKVYCILKIFRIHTQEHIQN